MTSAGDPNKDCVLAWEAMPDALQDALTPPQRGWLDGHLATCEACRAQFAQQRRLQRALALPAGAPVDVEAGLQRLLARIDAPDLERGRTLPRPRAGWAGPALVAAVVLQAIGLGAMGAKLWSLAPASGEPPAEYRTLSDDATAPPAGTIRLVPDPGMAVAEWDALLQANGLQIVAGPNAVGAYLVASRPGDAGRDALLLRLRASEGIRMAEPAGGTP